MKMLEIERKWIVDKKECPIFLYGENALNCKKTRVIQGYLNNGEGEWIIRVRKVESIFQKVESDSNQSKEPMYHSSSMYYLELKTRGDLTRKEIRYLIDRKNFEESLYHCKNIVKKYRYLWKTYNEQLKKEIEYEIDVYDDHKFIICEIEFKSEKEALSFSPPKWCVKDVTYDEEYKNMNL